MSCSTISSSNATISVHNALSAWVIWVGGTNYDMDAGDAVHNFTFSGTDPHPTLVSLLHAATSETYSSLSSAHEADYKQILTQSFSLDLGQRVDLNNPTDVLKTQYAVDVGNPYLEWVLFNYGRYLLASSARGVLPANLQGKWAYDSSNPWSAGEPLCVAWFRQILIDGFSGRLP